MCIQYTYWRRLSRKNISPFAVPGHGFPRETPDRGYLFERYHFPPGDRVWNRSYIPSLSGEKKGRRVSLVPINGNV